MEKHITKSFLIKKLGNIKSVAQLFDIYPQAVHKWEEEIPELRRRQLEDRRPDLIKAFKRSNNK